MKLCESVNPAEIYSGKNIKALPKLLADGRVPMSASQLMKYRINQSESFPYLKKNYFDTSDLIAYNPKKDGKVKLILTVDNQGKIIENGRKALELISLNSKLISGAVVLSDSQYNGLQGIEVATGNLSKTKSYLTQNEVLGNKTWRILARHPDEVPSEFAEDPALLQEYFAWVSSQTKYLTNMGVFYPDSLFDKNPKLRVWCIVRTDHRSIAYGKSNLDYDFGRFVGLMPEVLDVLGKSASNIKEYTMTFTIC